MSLFKANNAFAAIAAFAISAICMAAAIVPASPSGLIA
ncbi:recombination protein F [Erythrobacter sp. HI0063]|nr:recombination protein F [Erythrobacter sp. HI0063]MBO9510082.1 recombination protein F [Erythrobacter sp. A6_0]